MKKLFSLFLVLCLSGCVKLPSSSSSSINFDDLFNSSTNVSNNSENTSNEISTSVNNSSSTETDNSSSSSEDKVDDILPGSGFGPLHKK